MKLMMEKYGTSEDANRIQAFASAFGLTATESPSPGTPVGDKAVRYRLSNGDEKFFGFAYIFYDVIEIHINESGLEDTFSDALESCAMRGHIMHNFVRLIPASGRSFYRSTCATCGMSVDVRPRPAANQAGVAGDALALNCIRHVP